MKPFLDSLLLEVSLRPDLGRLLSAALLSSGMILLALAVTWMLRRRSAAGRNLVLRSASLGLLVLAFWQLMPRFEPPVTLQVELTAPTPLPMPVANLEPVSLPTLPPPAWWEYALSTVDRRAHLVWLLVAGALLLFRLLRASLSLRRLSKSSRLAGTGLQKACDDLASELGVKQTVSCHLVPGLGSPLLTGFWQTHLWLPAAAETWSAERLGAVFQHELAHLRRHDLGWQMLTSVASCLWWWQPLVPAAGRALRAEAEQAADDLAVTSGGDAYGYARTLVEIAAGWTQGRTRAPAAGVAMFGNQGNLQHRVRELLRDNRWRGRIGGGVKILIAIIGLMLLALASTRLDFLPRPDSYTSLAKLVAGGHIVANDSNVNWKEQMADFYGTIIETLESAEMKKRALVRVRALNPSLKEVNVDIRVMQTKGSAIFSVFAIGEEPKFTQILLNALLDEFIAFRQQIRDQGLERSLNTFTETVVKKSKELTDRTEKLEAFRKANNTTTALAADHQESHAKLQKLRARLAETKQRIADLDVMLADPGSAIGNLERGYTADGTVKLELGRGLTIAEQSYLKVKAEAFTLQQELDFLRQAKPSDTTKIAEMENQAAKARHLEMSWQKELAEQCDREKEALSKQQIQKLNTEISAAMAESLSFAAKLAELTQLEGGYAAAKQAYDEMFKKVQSLTDIHHIQTDYVAIQERASNAYKEINDRIFPVWKLWTPTPKTTADSGKK